MTLLETLENLVAVADRTVAPKREVHIQFLRTCDYKLVLQTM
jgi:hypothetical protein